MSRLSMVAMGSPQVHHTRIDALKELDTQLATARANAVASTTEFLLTKPVLTVLMDAADATVRVGAGIVAAIDKKA